MKHLIVIFMCLISLTTFAADAKIVAPIVPIETKLPVVPVVPVVPASPDLILLQTKRRKIAQQIGLLDESDVDYDVQLSELENEMFKTSQLIKAEIAKIKQFEQDAKTAEIRNQRAKIGYDVVDATVAEQVHLLTVYNKTKRTPEDMAVMNELTAVKNGFIETMINELLGKYANVSPSNKTANVTGDKPAGSRGNVGRAIVDMFIANRAAGMNDTDNKKAIVASGESRGTTGAEVLKYQQSIGEK